MNSKRLKSTHEFNQVHNLSIFTDIQNEMIATAEIVVEFPLVHVNITQHNDTYNCVDHE